MIDKHLRRSNSRMWPNASSERINRLVPTPRISWRQCKKESSPRPPSVAIAPYRHQEKTKACTDRRIARMPSPPAYGAPPAGRQAAPRRVSGIRAPASKSLGLSSGPRYLTAVDLTAIRPWPTSNTYTLETLCTHTSGCHPRVRKSSTHPCFSELTDLSDLLDYLSVILFARCTDWAHDHEQDVVLF